MSWDMFWTILAQAGIVIVVLFVLSAAMAGVWEGIRKDKK